MCVGRGSLAGWLTGKCSSHPRLLRKTDLHKSPHTKNSHSCCFYLAVLFFCKWKCLNGCYVLSKVKPWKNIFLTLRHPARQWPLVRLFPALFTAQTERERECVCVLYTHIYCCASMLANLQCDFWADDSLFLARSHYTITSNCWNVPVQEAFPIKLCLTFLKLLSLKSLASRRLVYNIYFLNWDSEKSNE